MYSCDLAEARSANVYLKMASSVTQLGIKPSDSALRYSFAPPPQHVLVGPLEYSSWHPRLRLLARRSPRMTGPRGSSHHIAHVAPAADHSAGYPSARPIGEHETAPHKACAFSLNCLARYGARTWRSCSPPMQLRRLEAPGTLLPHASLICPRPPSRRISCFLGAGTSTVEPVPDSYFGQHVLRPGRVDLDLLAQVGHVNPHIVGILGMTGSP